MPEALPKSRLEDGPRPRGGPVSPVNRTMSPLEPLLGRLNLVGGFWGLRQAQNRSVSIPHGIAMLEESGALWNLKLAAGREHGDYRLPLYRDANVYVVLEAIAWDRRHGQVEAHEQFFRATAELLAAAQADDGYLNSYVQVCNPGGRFSNPEHGHELFCAGHLVQAAIADERTGGNGALMEVARRFADYLCELFLGGRRRYVEGHPEVEMALVELYRLTGQRRYLDLATVLVDQRGYGTLQPGRFGLEYFQDDVPLRESRSLRGHAVRALYLAAGATDCYIETENGALLQALTAQWQDMVASKTYLTGGLGSRHEGEAFGDPYELPSDRAYCETCASIAAVMWSWRMLLVTGQARYAAFIERVLYNAFAAALGGDGRSYFYVNPLKSQGAHHRKPWYETACCPPNAMRLLASIEDYVATSTEEGLQVHQFMSCEIDAAVGGHPFKVSVECGYPWDGTVRLRVAEAPPVEAAISLRVPDWAEHFSLELDGKPYEAGIDALGYLPVERRWRTGEELMLCFPMRARIVEPHPAIDAVRGCFALERGPLVYCFEGVDVTSMEMGRLRLSPGGPVDDRHAQVIGGEEMVALHVDVSQAAAPGEHPWPYWDVAGTPRTPASAKARGVTAVPYYAWDRREPCEMQVWVPATGPDWQTTAKNTGGREATRTGTEPTTDNPYRSGNQAIER